MSQHFHLNSGVLYRHRTHGEGLVANDFRHALFRRGILILDEFQLIAGESIVADALVELRAVAVNLTFHLRQRLINGEEEVFGLRGLRAEDNAIAHGDGDFDGANIALGFLAQPNLHFRIGQEIAAHALRLFLNAAGHMGRNRHILRINRQLHKISCSFRS